MSKKEKRNYLKLGVIIILTIIITFFLCNIYRNYNKKNINAGYLSKYTKNIDYKELANTMTELDSNTFIYLTYTGSDKVYSFEKKLRKTIKKLNYEDNFIYVNCTLELKDNYSVKNLNKLLSVGNNEIILPAIIYFKDNTPIDYIDSNDGLLEIGDYQQLLDKYELESRKS